MREAATSGPPAPTIGNIINPVRANPALPGIQSGAVEIPVDRPPRTHVVPPPTPMAEDIVRMMRHTGDARPARLTTTGGLDQPVTRPHPAAGVAEILERASRRTPVGAPYRVRDEGVPPPTPTLPPIPLAGAGGGSRGTPGAPLAPPGGFYPPSNPLSMALPGDASKMGDKGPPQDVTAILAVVQKISTDTGGILAVISKISVSGPGGQGGAAAQGPLTALASEATKEKRKREQEEARKQKGRQQVLSRLGRTAGMTALSVGGFSGTTKAIAQGAMTGGLPGAGMALAGQVQEKGVVGVAKDIGKDALLAPVKPAIQAVQGAMSAFGDAVTAPVAALQALGEAAGSGVKVLAQIAGAGLVDAFQSMGSAMMPFVQALSPSAVMVFQQAMRDLNAVVGVALMPVFNALTAAVRQTADTLLPISKQLQPIFASLASTALSMLQPALQAFAQVMESLVMPALSFFAELMKGMVPIFQAAGAVFTAVTKTIGQVLSGLFGDTKGFLSGFQAAMKSLANAAVIAAGGLAQLVGATRFLSNLHEAVSKGPETQRSQNLSAPQNASTGSVASYASTVLRSAFTATAAGGPQPQTEKDLLAEANGILDQMVTGQIDVKQEIVDAIEALPGQLGDAIVKAIFGDRKTFDAAAEEGQRRLGNARTGSAFGPAGAILGALLPGGG